ncbi:MAG: hypothetical protein ACJ71Z_08765 [Aeromicrobium sp.]
MPRSLEPAGLVPRIPVWVLYAAAAVLAANVCVLIVGAVTVGVTLDEPSHVHRLQGFLVHGWYVSENHVTNGQVTQDGGYVYAPVVALIGHVLGVLVGTEQWQTVSESSDAYVVRHLVVASLAVLGMAAAGATARIMLRSWQWGIVGAAAVSAMPVYIGHGMFNIKDLPVAAGYSVATLGAVALTRPTIVTRQVGLLAAGALALGIWITAGVHPAMLVGIGASIVVALVMSWARTRRDDPDGRRAMKARVLTALAGCLGGYLALVACYPKLFLRPDLLLVSIFDSGAFPWSGYTLTAGTFLPAQGGPSYYLPLWFAAQTPVVVGALFLIAFVWFVRATVGVTSGRSVDGNLLAGVTVVLVQALFLPWAAIAGGSTVYQGARQMLFVLPAIALLGTVGAWLLARQASRAGRAGLVAAVFGVLVVGLASPTLSGAALVPFNYTWFNELTALRPIDGNWTTDYEWASSRAVIRKVDTLEEGRCVIVQRHSRCDRDQVTPYWNSVGSEPVGPLLGSDEMWRIAYGNPAVRHDAPSVDNTVGRDCQPQSGVTRQLYWHTVTMSSLARCRR